MAYFIIKNNMKKFFLAFFLFIILTGFVFADHPDDKLGLGLMGGWHGNWATLGGWGHGYTAFSLKIPNVPVFWAVNLGFGSNYLYIGVSGDKYLYERDIVSAINLHWIVGLGGWINIGFSDVKDFEFGARLPIGVSWHLLGFLELFIDTAPSLGLKVYPEVKFPAGGWPLEIGIRFWL
jgi:hypothetical protein